ncbi:DUF4153 domain-containing protein [Glaesserella sp.]|uniref:DUF4153 domain-containing protein n=1 Tax=Glaesserella sp. TaxID=2094731 RepID=UPI0035A15A0B
MAIFSSLSDSFRQIWKKYPIEILLSLVTFVAILFADFRTPINEEESIFLFILLFPNFFTVIYLMNIHRFHYLWSILYPILGSALAYAFGFKGHEQVFLGLYFVHVILFFTRGFNPDNRHFIYNIITSAINLAFALILAGIVAGSIFLIHISIDALFKLKLFEEYFLGKLCLGVFVFCTAFFFLILENRTAPYGEQRESLLQVGEILINYIFSPIVMIYTLIVYLYLLTILFAFELPVSSVSTIILPYIGLGLLCIALRQFSENPKWQWFYCHFAYFSIIPLGLLWLGIYERISTYGFTIVRIWLIAISLLVTLFVVFSLHKKWLQYRLFSLMTMISIIVMTMVISPEKIALNSQQQRFITIMKQLNGLDENGKIRAEFLSNTYKHKVVDKEKYKQLNDLYYFYLGNPSMIEFYGQESLSTLASIYYEFDNAPAGQYVYAKGLESVANEELIHSRQRGLAIDISQYREFIPAARGDLLVVSANDDPGGIVTFTENGQPLHFSPEKAPISIVSSYHSKLLFSFNEEHVQRVLRKHGIKLATRYDHQQLVPALNELLEIKTEKGELLVFDSIKLSYIEKGNFKGYVFVGGELSGYFR